MTKSENSLRGHIIWRDQTSGLVIVTDPMMEDEVKAEDFRGFGGVADPIVGEIMEGWVQNGLEKIQKLFWRT